MGRPVVWATLVCATCGGEKLVKPCDLRKGRRYCSIECRTSAHPPPTQPGNQHAVTDNPKRSALHWRARQLKPGGGCERCPGPGTVVHHRDHDPHNNDLANLERLCRPCHARHHHGVVYA